MNQVVDQRLQVAPNGTTPGTPAPPDALAPVRSLYVHIPFCERKCEYCDFTSVAGLHHEREYVTALRAEIRMLGALLPGVQLDTVFVGGGTPSLIDPRLLGGVMDDVRESFIVNGGAEITLEANPSSTDGARAREWRAAGFTRVSLGVQSLEPDTLRFLGRVHDAGRALAAVGEVRDAGLAAVNCDLIYAVPGLGDARWRRTVQRVRDAGPTHISCYELTVEPGTPLHVAVRRGRVRPVSGPRALRQHRIAVELLENSGYAQYEVSNFALPGQRCRHNLVYWQCGYYAAAGVGAHGHLPQAAAAALGVDAGEGAVSFRHWHGRGIDAYIASVRAGLVPLRGFEAIDARMREDERVLLGLRLREGVAISDLGMLTAARTLAANGLLELDGGVVRATRRGEDILNELAAQLTAGLAA